MNARSRIAVELLVAASAASWRVVVCPVRDLPQDWGLLLALFWIFTVVGSKSRYWSTAAVSVMTFLLGIYVTGQARHTLEVLGILP